MAEKPVLLITAGPTGSGKSELIAAALRVLQLDPDQVDQFLIDDLVQNDPVYKREVLEILQSLDLDQLKQPSEELFDLFGRAYFSVRQHQGCGMVNSGGCDAQLDRELRQAFERRENILFETTGQVWPHWLLQMTDGQYEVVLAIPLVPFCTLIERNRDRAFQDAVEFLADPSLPAPRLPDVRRSGPFLARVERVKQLIFELVENNCLAQANKLYDRQYCSNVPIDRILLFDNSHRPSRLVADLQRDAELEPTKLYDLVQLYMSTNLTTC